MKRLALVLLVTLAMPLRAQTPLSDAEVAIAAGQPWHATELLTPLLASPATRTPDVVILAARAAAGWEGWATVRRLLEKEPWLDTRFDRIGRRLLAEAALAEQHPDQALTHALAAAVPAAGRGPAEDAKRFILVARAYDRLDQLDSAAAAYRRAAILLPDLTDWISLRAAGVTRDSAQRVALYAVVAVPAAVARIPSTEALARDRSNDLEGAATRYDKLGAHVSAIRVRWRGAATDTARRALAGQLAEVIHSATALADVRDALDLVEKVDPPFTREQRLIVARRAATSGRAQDAVDEFEGSEKEAPLLLTQIALRTPRPLGTVSRWPDAAKEFGMIHDPALAGRAAYFRARALLRAGSDGAAITALQEVIKKYPGDTVAAPIALYLLGDLAIDGGHPDTARTLYLRLATKYLNSAERPRALLVAALVSLQEGHADAAVQELTRGLQQRTPAGVEGDAWRYWLARARIAAGDTALGRTGLRELLSRGPESYYALRAASRLDTMPWPIVPMVPITGPDSLDGVFARAARLEALGLDTEARFERDRVAGDAKGASAVRVGEAFLAQGYPSRASQMAVRAKTAGVPKDPILWRLLYPMPFSRALRDRAAREGVDPLFAASVIRQESGFDPRATSRTNARGLMQVEPSTGHDLATAMGLADFDPAMLWLPDVNLSLGMRHFAEAVARYPEVERAMAAYNAGTSRVDHWSQTPLDGNGRAAEHTRDPLDDVEVFVERIPFVETRDYVRSVFRNLSVYRMLYPQ